jgi:ferritin-like metal-binding protein YciE
MKTNRSASSGSSRSANSGSKSGAGSRSKSSNTAAKSSGSTVRNAAGRSGGAAAGSSGGPGARGSQGTQGNASSRSRSANSRSNSASRTSTARNNRQSTPANDLHKVFVDTLKDIYWAEKHLVRGLTKMARASQHEELRAAFEQHRTETEQQIEQLEQAFESLEIRAQGKRCEAMEGLLREAQDHVEEYSEGPGRDAALIVGAQKIEHYEIAAYGSLRTFAGALGYPDCEQIFQAILDQESETDEKLTQVAMAINQEALQAHEEEGASEEEEEEATADTEE